MDKLPLFIKIIINLFFFFLYTIISIFLVNFTYWFVLTKILNAPVPWASDGVHIKMAVVVFIVILILTFIFRKYFYFSLSSDDNTSNNLVQKEAENLDNSNMYFIDTDNEKKMKQKKELKEKQNIKKEEDNDDMKIYIWKEIK